MILIKQVCSYSMCIYCNLYHTKIQCLILFFTDPDAPSRANPTRREIRHWLVGNIPENKVNDGETLTAYVGSGPPKDTGNDKCSNYSLEIKLKRRKECGTYLATACRHRWRLKMTMKKDRSNVAFFRHCGLRQL